jgi:hypothetical protein
MKLLYPLPAALALLLVLPEGSLWSQPAPRQAKEPEQARKGDSIGLPDDLPTSLDAAISRALQNDPDIRLAELKIEQAQAELRRQRLKVTQDVTSAFRRFQHSRDLLERQQSLVETGELTLVELGPTMISFAENEALLRYHLGVTVADDRNGGRGEAWTDRQMPLSHRERPGLPSEIRKRLESVRVAAQEDIPLEEVENLLSEVTGMKFLFDNDVRQMEFLTLIEVPNVLMLLTVLHDKDELCFLVRDYGIFVTYEPRARGMFAPSIPEDLPYTPGAPAHGGGMGMGGMGMGGALRGGMF